MNANAIIRIYMYIYLYIFVYLYMAACLYMGIFKSVEIYMNVYKYIYINICIFKKRKILCIYICVAVRIVCIPYNALIM